MEENLMNKKNSKDKQELINAVTNMIDEGSEKVTTLSKDPEAKYESIGEKEPGHDS
jgi:DNA-binding ferritin-like protein